jgi:hypothetical protein
MTTPEVEAGFTDLICYMIASARGLISEPKLYGPSRLVESTRRLIHLAEDCGMHDAHLEAVARRIEEDRLKSLLEGEEGLVRFLDELVDLLATWVAETG